MGIPHLTTLLSPHFSLEQLGCSTTICPQHSQPQYSNVVIDGPSLAYHVYSVLQRLLLSSPSPPLSSSLSSSSESKTNILPNSIRKSNAYGQPTYTAIGEAYVGFLDELREAGLVVHSIYFDGALPDSKREVRLSRLQSYLRQLTSFHVNHSQGIFRASDPPSLTLKDNEIDSWQCTSLISPPNLGTSLATSANLPAAPFLISVVLDTLRSHPLYKTCVHVVPGEAESWCAAIAKNTGASSVILSNDSDLLLHDIGDGAIAWLRELYLGDCDHGGKIAEDHNPTGITARPQGLMCKVARPREIESKLFGDTLEHDGNSSSLLRVGFEVQRDHHRSLLESVKAAKQAFGTDNYHNDRRTAFVSFAKDFALPTIHSSDTDAVAVTRDCDPRLAEVGIQLCNSISTLLSKHPRVSSASIPVPNGSTAVLAHSVESKPRGAGLTVDAHLPFLISDPSRVSAWTPSLYLRRIAYSILAHAIGLGRVVDVGSDGVEISEYTPKGPRIAPNRFGAVIREIEIINVLQSLANRLSTVLNMLSVLDKAEDSILGDISRGERGGTERPAQSIPPWRKWYLIALHEIRAWYLDAARHAPADEDIKTVLGLDMSSTQAENGSAPKKRKKNNKQSKKARDRARLVSGRNRSTWTAIQLMAEVQGWLYSLRMVHQALSVHESLVGPDMSAELSLLLRQLPDLVDLMDQIIPKHDMGLDETNIEYYLDFIKDDKKSVTEREIFDFAIR